MPDTRIDVSAPAELRKWPSLNKERVSASLGARPYMIGEGGTLDECIQQFMQLPEAQRHLYEIHTVPQTDLVGAVLSTDHIVELRGSGIFLENEHVYGNDMTPKERAKALVARLQKLTMRSRPNAIEAAIRQADTIFQFMSL
jgi:hypothetical protein